MINKLLYRARQEGAEQQVSLLGSYDSRALTIVLICYLVAMLSLPATHLGDLVVMGCWLMIGSSMAELRLKRVFSRVVIALPFIILVGVFNPILDRTPLVIIAGVTITRGWVTFIAILLRGLLAVWGVTIVTEAVGFTAICGALRRMGVPKIFTEQLLFVHRYLFVIVDEAADMQQARLARSGGRRGLKLGEWGTIIGTLLIRSIDRAERIYSAMVARGYRGVMPERGGARRWRWRDTLFLIVSTLLIVATAIFQPIHSLSQL